MKLLLDQNISFRIIKQLDPDFKHSEQVRRLSLENKSDLEIWKYAKKNDFAIMTFDADFYDISLVHGHPPKIILLRTGNLTTKNLLRVLQNQMSLIKQFISGEEYKDLSCFEIFDES